MMTGGVHVNLTSQEFSLATLNSVEIYVPSTNFSCTLRGTNVLYFDTYVDNLKYIAGHTLNNNVMCGGVFGENKL